MTPIQHIRPLPRHPDPRPTEGLWGYMLRVSHSNGFSSPWGLIRRAGMEQYEARGASINVAKLAFVTRKDGTRLQSIGYVSATQKRSYLLLGHSVPRTALELEAPHICPACVDDLKFIEAHWDLAIMTACANAQLRAIGRKPSHRQWLSGGTEVEPWLAGDSRLCRGVRPPVHQNV